MAGKHEVTPARGGDTGTVTPDAGAAAGSPSASPSTRAYPVGPRNETQRHSRDTPQGRPLRIGLLGTSGAGKTTYQTALAYVLVRQHEGEDYPDEPLFGHPVGQETKQFLSIRVHELIAGQFPLPTNDATNLFYRLETDHETKLVSIMDYRGGDLTEIYARDSGQPLPPALSEVSDYFADCDAYIFLVNAKTLILSEDDPEFRHFWNEFLIYKDILQALIDTRPRFRGKISDPFALVATQTDSVDLDDRMVRDRLDRALANLQRELERHVRYPETFLTSAIGRNFLDPVSRKKLPRAKLEPENVLAPIRFILRTRRAHRKLRRRLALTGLAIMLLGGLILGFVLAKIKAEVELSEAIALGKDLQDIPPGQEVKLKQRLVQLNEKEKSLGFFSVFLTDDSKLAFETSRSAILAELQRRMYDEFIRATEESMAELGDDTPDGRWEETIRDIRNAAALILSTGDNAYAEEILVKLDEVYSRYDAMVWNIAERVNTTHSYATYLDRVGANRPDGPDRLIPNPAHVYEANLKIKELQRQSFEKRWAEIVEFANRTSGRYEQIVRTVHTFIQECPAEHRRVMNPPPDQFFDRMVKAWDEKVWSDLMNYYRTTVDIPDGSVTSNLRPCVERFREYINTISTYTVPAQEAEARRMIAFLEDRAAEKEYTIRLIDGRFRNYDEEKPDAYIKVFVNDQLKFSTEANPRHDTANPVWHTDFKLRWKAYDRIRVEVWDQDPWPNSHDHIFQVERGGLDSLRVVFSNRIYYGDSANPDYQIRFRIIE